MNLKLLNYSQQGAVTLPELIGATPVQHPRGRLIGMDQCGCGALAAFHLAITETYLACFLNNGRTDAYCLAISTNSPGANLNCPSAALKHTVLS